MKHTFNSERKIRLVGNAYSMSNSPTGINDLNIEGKSVKEVINSLMTDPTYLNYYVEHPNLACFIFQYDEAKVDPSITKWYATPEVEKERADDLAALGLKRDELMKDMKVKFPQVDWHQSLYFNQTILHNPTEVKAMIEKHPKYKQAQKLIAQVEAAKKKAALAGYEEQKQIRKENDVWTLAKLIKHHEKDFGKLLKQAKEKVDTIQTLPELKTIDPSK